MEKDQHNQPNLHNIQAFHSKTQTELNQQNQQNLQNQHNKKNCIKQKCIQFQLSHIIQLMKKLNKNDPLFKPIKKLKTAVESIGVQNVCMIPTKKIVVFHFGLGNQLDKDIIVNSSGIKQYYQVMQKQLCILPGKCYCILYFKDWQRAEHFMKQRILLNAGKQKQRKSQKLQEERHQKNIHQNISESQTIQIQKKEIHIDKKQELPLYYDEFKYQNLSRLMVFLYLKESDNSKTSIQDVNIQNCQSNYIKNYIPGLHLFEDFLSRQQQIELLQKIDQQPWQKLSNRRVQHYGYEFKYGRNQIDKDQIHHKMPQFFNKIQLRLTKLVNEISGQNISYDQLTINDYFAGHGIPPHFDTHSPFEQYFVAISMLSPITMGFKKYDGTQKQVFLKDRSIVVFSGQARYAWIHGIACRKIDKVDNQIVHRSRRLSLTFRKIKRTPCTCKYYFYCDSQGYSQQTMKKNNPLLTKYLANQHTKTLNSMSSIQIYDQYVKKAYNSFGYDFHNKVIPQIKQYLEKEIQSQKLEGQQHKQKQTETETETEISSVSSMPIIMPISKFVLDIGCGNGQYKKYLSKNWFYLPTQFCTVMTPLEDQIHMNGLKLNLRDGLFDIILIIAVLHHFTRQDDRIKCLKQANRVLKNDGIIYLTVFNYHQKQQIYPNQDILLDYCLPVHKKTEQRKQIQKQDGRVQQKGETYQRYYHLFKQVQLREIIQKSGLQIQQLIKTKQNLIVKLKKHKNF